MIRDSDATPIIGEWVLISCGLYKRDLVFVSSMQDWQGVSILLVPWIAYSDDSQLLSKRKKSAIHPPPQLFNPIMVPNYSCIQPMWLSEHIYQFGPLRLENGLLLQSFNFHLISQGVLHMLSEVFFAFHKSKHSKVLTAKFPCPPWVWVWGKWASYGIADRQAGKNNSSGTAIQTRSWAVEWRG